MKNYFYLLVITFLCSCQNKSTTGQEVAVEEEKEEIMLVGTTERNNLYVAPYKNWYDSSYHVYTIDSLRLSELASKVNELDIEIFFGTWCSDSQREVPAFFKILDYLKYDDNRVKLVALDRDKVEPGNLQDGKNIEFVPTIIFKRADTEIGRIIEMPLETLEKDLENITKI